MWLSGCMWLSGFMWLSGEKLEKVGKKYLKVGKSGKRQ